MTREQIKETINTMLKTETYMSFTNVIDEFTDDSSLIDDLALDSIQVLELIVSLEKKFDIVFDAQELNIDMFDKYGKLIDLVMRKLG